MDTTRRAFLGSVLGTAAAGAMQQLQPAEPSTAKPLHVASNQYTWTTFFKREKRDWEENLDASLAEVAQSGVKGFEPNATSPEHVRRLGPLLKKHGLEMRSLYVNSKLHAPDEAQQSIDQVLAIAEAAAPLGTTIIVTNPSPIRWGGPEDKSEGQLRTQATNLDRLGAELRKRKLTLAYHNHDADLRNAAREFHHMLLRTDPRHVAFCLDSHWIYRGAGNSQLALLDVLKLYGPRIVELHLRQSVQGTWTEAFGPGDIDYPRVVKELVQLRLHPQVVLEQAVEARTPNTLKALEAQKRSLKYTLEHFTPLAAN
jgi:inosose dehydratase